MDCLILRKRIKAEQQDRERKVETDVARLRMRDPCTPAEKHWNICRGKGNEKCK